MRSAVHVASLVIFRTDLLQIVMFRLVYPVWFSFHGYRHFLKPGQKIGVLTASADSISEHLFASCGVSKELQDRLVIRGLGKEPEFSCIIEQRGEFDNGIVRDEVVAKVKEIVEECPDVGAILLECSDMPPYAWAVQAETGLPVFDFITLIKWLHSGVCQTPYCGFM